MLRAQLQTDSQAVLQPVSSPWLVTFTSSPMSSPCPGCAEFRGRYGGVWVAVVGKGFGSVSDAGDTFVFLCHIFSCFFSFLFCPHILTILFFLRSKRSRFCRQTTMPRFRSAPIQSLCRETFTVDFTRRRRCGCRLASCCAACHLQQAALPISLSWLQENRVNNTQRYTIITINSTQCNRVFTLPRLCCRRISHPGKCHRVRVSTSHSRSSQELAHVRRFFCDSTGPSLRPRRHQRQVRAFASLPLHHRTVHSCVQLHHQSRRLIVRAKHVVQRQQHFVQGAVAAAAFVHALRDHVAAASWRRQQQDNRGRHSVLSSHPAAATGALLLSPF
jgi:hypothetical protein